MMTMGARAALEWLQERGLGTKKPWFVEIALDVVDRPASRTYSNDTDSRFHINIYPEEWGVFFCHGSRASWIRVTDEPFVHGRDDHGLLGELAALSMVGGVLRGVEQRYRLDFRRDHALIHSNLGSAKPAIREWLSTL